MFNTLLLMCTNQIQKILFRKMDFHYLLYYINLNISCRIPYIHTITTEIFLLTTFVQTIKIFEILLSRLAFVFV